MNKRDVDNENLEFVLAGITAATLMVLMLRFFI
jgi:hypothetical protein